MNDSPPEMLAALEALGATPERWRRNGHRAYCWAGEHFARFSTAPGDIARLAFERAVRDAVHALDSPVLRTPAVLAFGDHWMVEERIVPEPPVMEAVANAAVAVASLTLPDRPGAEAREGRMHALRRRLSLLGTSLVRDAARAKAIMRDSALPSVTSHGDFHPNNVFVSGGTVWVVDWELAGTAPAGSDSLRYWCAVEAPEDRHVLFEALVSRLGEEHRQTLLQLRYALVVRSLVGARANVAGFDRNPVLADRLAAMLPELRREALNPA